MAVHLAASSTYFRSEALPWPRPHGLVGVFTDMKISWGGRLRNIFININMI